MNVRRGGSRVAGAAPAAWPELYLHEAQALGECARAVAAGRGAER